jgi:deoxyadenosine/deoxycytidine kinase
VIAQRIRSERATQMPTGMISKEKIFEDYLILVENFNEIHIQKKEMERLAKILREEALDWTMQKIAYVETICD